MSTRKIWIDNLKGLAITLVVLGHLFQSRFIDIFRSEFNFIYSFHMPLFMFLSGLFIYKAEDAIQNNEIKNFIAKKTIQLITPFLVWGSLNCILHKENLFTEFIYKGGAYYWFLLSLFEFYCIFIISCYISRSICKSISYYKTALFIILAIPYFIIVLTDKLIPQSTIAKFLNFHHIILNYPFFIAAYFYSKKGIITKFTDNIVIVIMSIIYIFINNYYAIIANKHLNAACIIVCLVYFFKKFSDSKLISSAFSQFGYNSLIIYTIHYLLLAIYPKGISSIFETTSLSIFEKMQLFILTLFSTYGIMHLCVIFASIFRNNKYTEILFGDNAGYYVSYLRKIWVSRVLKLRNKTI